MWPIPTNVIDLGVNIDHVATLRNARDASYPDIVDAAIWAEEAGADLITLHLREDRRHIRDADVWRLRPLLRTRMNLECAITDEMLAIACAVQPHNVCLVPERRTEITTEGGLDVAGQFEAVQAACHQLHTAGIHVSLFVDPVPRQIQAAAQTGVHAIELHTGCYANASDAHQQTLELQRIKESVSLGLQQGLRIHAGHGLHYKNVMAIAALPGIAELNIGHAIVAHALFVGWRAAISEIKALMIQARLKNNHA